MGQFLLYYQRPEPATWVYLSSFLVIAIYFMFHRMWSIRNLDIILLIALAPGLMLVYEGRKKSQLQAAAASQSATLPELASQLTSAMLVWSDQPPGPNAGPPLGKPQADVPASPPGRAPAAAPGSPSGTPTGPEVPGPPSLDPPSPAPPVRRPGPPPATQPTLQAGPTDSRTPGPTTPALLTTTPISPTPTPQDPPAASEDSAPEGSAPERFGDTDTGSNRTGDTGTSTASTASSATPPPASATLTPPLPSSTAAAGEWNGPRLEYWGYLWLLATCALLCLRMLLDTAMVRRPLLEPNLSAGGLTFLGVSLLLFLLANVVTSQTLAPATTVGGASAPAPAGGRLGPGYVLLNLLPQLETVPDQQLTAAATRPPTTAPSSSEVSSPASAADPTVPAGSAASLADASVAPPAATPPTGRRAWLTTIARVMAILANLCIVFAIVAVGYWHFDNLRTGIGAATLYLCMPYTALMTGRVDHALPAAMLLLAVLTYRRPLLSGLSLGLAAGLVYYPFFLLILWISFYWLRGLARFLGGFLLGLVLLTLALLIRSPSELLPSLQQMYGVFAPAMDDLQGVWGLGWHPYFRLPVLVVFILLSISFAFWPAQKNLATLVSCSAAIMLAAQFWHGYGGGIYLAWFVPLVLLTVFRPNLDDRVAVDVVRPVRWR
jgi:hypothetical protein